MIYIFNILSSAMHASLFSPLAHWQSVGPSGPVITSVSLPPIALMTSLQSPMATYLDTIPAIQRWLYVGGYRRRPTCSPCCLVQ
jgi:hypothetical protein